MQRGNTGGGATVTINREELQALLESDQAGDDALEAIESKLKELRTWGVRWQSQCEAAEAKATVFFEQLKEHNIEPRTPADTAEAQRQADAANGVAAMAM